MGLGGKKWGGGETGVCASYSTAVGKSRKRGVVHGPEEGKTEGKVGKKWGRIKKSVGGRENVKAVARGDVIQKNAEKRENNEQTGEKTASKKKTDRKKLTEIL